ncbi:protein kinase domain-containing protein [Enhygromyxa salina]|uniref:serine/threonine-protein kinase n=1 Tax=Enhygromyxa salina TaxID=215803 RepID=UPI0015E69ECF|nr:serine/threonine-protein kinase [Enhygromyxa salina]
MALDQRPLRLMPGQIIPGTSWRITQWLGEGNMGVVYEARHVEIDRRAAIKIIASSLAEDPAAIADFRSEASASAKIGSPNIADVFDFAVLDDGRLMMAMEFVPGRSLHEILIDEGCLSPSRLIGLFRQVCKGLQAAHDAGLVHRDVKPENIMVGDIGGRRDTVKLVDFGIVSILGERSLRHAGTPYYMPPEGMADGAIDGRYDIYSVGCVMYEMLVGVPPFVDRNLQRVLQMHAYDPVPALITTDASVPDALIEVVRRCLAKDPADRYASMKELEVALCEAQIGGQLRTTWDDLALPAIEPERHAKLLSQMPSRTSRRGVSGWWVPVLLAFGVVAGGMIAWPMLRAEPVLGSSRGAASAQTDDLVDRAHEAAALAYYVYPPVVDPRADTAYRILIELESLDSEEALRAARELRLELASTLVRLGDETWDKAGGEPFALDFYVQAMLFAPLIEPARSRAAISPGELLVLHRKAGTGDFTVPELIAVEPLLALVEPNLADKRDKLEQFKLLRSDQRPASTTAQLDALIENEFGLRLPNVAGSRNGAGAPTVSAPSEIAIDDDEDPSSQRQATVGKRAADKVIAKADAAREGARLEVAEKLYHKALRIEAGRVDALAGLGHVYFQRANHANAATYYEMAVRRSRRDATLRIALGDTYTKLLRYEQALEQYETAKALGSSKAAGRIARIDQRSGG